MLNKLECSKNCAKCKELKPLEAFTRQTKGRFGKHSQCKKCMARNTKDYTLSHKDARAEYNKKYKAKNKETLSEYNRNYLKKYYEDNKAKLIKQTSEYTAKRTREDVNFRLARNLRRRLHHALKGTNKAESTLALLGCTLLQFRAHLETKFRDGMTWKNYGKFWHVDHIRPLALFDLKDEMQLRKAAHFSNMQPLLAQENLRKSKKV